MSKQISVNTSGKESIQYNFVSFPFKHITLPVMPFPDNRDMQPNLFLFLNCTNKY